MDRAGDGIPTLSSTIDLHMHSTASDGAFAPADVVAHAAKNGVRVVALTDHDTVAGVPEAVRAGDGLDVRVIAGCEFSTAAPWGEMHVLGYFLPIASAELEDFLADCRADRGRRARGMVERLRALGVEITDEDVLADAAGGAIGRPHVARALIAEGWATDFRDAFDRYLGTGKPGYVAKDRLAVTEAIGLIHRAGGLAVLAHPAHLGTRERVAALVEQGMDGLEVRHPSHSSEDTLRLTALVEHFGLVPSGGSDWHGAADGPRTLGMMRVPAEWLSRQDDRRAARAA